MLSKILGWFGCFHVPPRGGKILLWITLVHMIGCKTSGWARTCFFICVINSSPLLEKIMSTSFYWTSYSYNFATTAEYHTVAHLFGVARCTVCLIFHEACNAIVSKLMPVYILFPTGDELKEVVKGFKEKWDFQQCVGSIDGSHISVTPSFMNHSDYYNGKGFYANSVLYRKVSDGKILQGSSLQFCGSEIPILLVGG